MTYQRTWLYMFDCRFDFSMQTLVVNSSRRSWSGGASSGRMARFLFMLS